MPMSIHVHHGLMDGLHLGQFQISRNHESVVVAFVTLQETLLCYLKH
jgi:chloramphenicol O-acetyltransferase